MIRFYAHINITMNINRSSAVLAWHARTNLIGPCRSSSVLCSTREWTSMVLECQASMH